MHSLRETTNVHLPRAAPSLPEEFGYGLHTLGLFIRHQVPGTGNQMHAGTRDETGPFLGLPRRNQAILFAPHNQSGNVHAMQPPFEPRADEPALHHPSETGLLARPRRLKLRAGRSWHVPRDHAQIVDKIFGNIFWRNFR